MLPSSDGNLAIFDRFQEEGLDQVEFYDSDVSEGELDDAIGELQAVNELASRPQEERLRAALPFHIIFVVDASSSMATKDVDGKERLAAVFDACQSLVLQQAADDSAQQGDCYTLVSFDTSAQVWFKRLDGKETEESILSVQQNLKPVVHSTRFNAAFRKIAEVLDGKKPAEDVRIIFLSDGAPHDGGLGTRGVDSTNSSDVTAEMLVSSLETELLGHEALCGIKQLVIYTVAFGSDFRSFEAYLKVLADRTGGEHHVSSLSNFDLCRAFGTIASSITTTRTSHTASVTLGGVCQQRFDSTVANKCCERSCMVQRVQTKRTKTNKKAPIEEYELQLRSSQAAAKIESNPFAQGGMRLVYTMEDSYNVEKKSKRPMKMVAKRLIRREHASIKEMLPFCRSTEMAILFRGNFVKELRKIGANISIFFVPCYLYSYSRCGTEKNYFVAEQFLEGDFIKFNSNNGYVNRDHPNTELLQAFSHYTFVQSKGKYLVVDLQGAVDNRCLMLTDPQVLSRAKSSHRVFGPGDLGFEGVKKFFETHECGETCTRLALYEKQQKFQADMELQRRQCVICLSSSRSTCFQPCSHSLACEECALELVQRSAPCPMCRVAIQGFDKGVFSQTYIPKKPSQAKRPVPAQVARPYPAGNVQPDLLLLPSVNPEAQRAAAARRETAAKAKGKAKSRPTLNVRSGRPGQSGGNYKTNLCEFYLNGECFKGRECTFAHGFHELRR